MGLARPQSLSNIHPRKTDLNRKQRKFHKKIYLIYRSAIKRKKCPLGMITVQFCASASIYLNLR